MFCASGRDSVIAQDTCNDVAGSDQRSHMTPEEKDRDLIRRLEGQFLKADDPYSLSALRADFQDKDTDKAGKLIKQDVLQVHARALLFIANELQI